MSNQPIPVLVTTTEKTKISKLAKKEPIDWISTGNSGAMSSVRFRCSFSSIRYSAIAREIELPSSAR